MGISGLLLMKCPWSHEWGRRGAGMAANCRATCCQLMGAGSFANRIEGEMRIARVVLLGFAVCLVTEFAHGSTNLEVSGATSSAIVYVDAASNSTVIPCGATIDTACSTISAALRVAENDTKAQIHIGIAAGEYCTCGVETQACVTLGALDVRQPYSLSSCSSCEFMMRFANNTCDVEISGAVITDASTTGSLLVFSCGASLRLDNVVFQNSSSSGALVVADNVTSVEFQNVRVVHCSSSSGNGACLHVRLLSPVSGWFNVSVLNCLFDHVEGTPLALVDNEQSISWSNSAFLWRNTTVSYSLLGSSAPANVLLHRRVVGLQLSVERSQFLFNERLSRVGVVCEGDNYEKKYTGLFSMQFIAATGALVASDLSISDNVFESNAVHANTGGAVHLSSNLVEDSTIGFRGCRFFNNSSCNGGALMLYAVQLQGQSEVIVHQNTFYKTNSEKSGGALFWVSRSLPYASVLKFGISLNNFTGNFAGGQGGIAWYLLKGDEQASSYFGSALFNFSGNTYVGNSWLYSGQYVDWDMGIDVVEGIFAVGARNETYESNSAPIGGCFLQYARSISTFSVEILDSRFDDNSNNYYVVQKRGVCMGNRPCISNLLLERCTFRANRGSGSFIIIDVLEFYDPHQSGYRYEFVTAVEHCLLEGLDDVRRADIRRESISYLRGHHEVRLRDSMLMNAMLYVRDLALLPPWKIVVERNVFLGFGCSFDIRGMTGTVSISSNSFASGSSMQVTAVKLFAAGVDSAVFSLLGNTFVGYKPATGAGAVQFTARIFYETDFAFSECSFLGNAGDNGGGVAIWAEIIYGGSLAFDSCRFVNNSASSDGGAVFFGWAQNVVVEIGNSTFDGNAAGTGGTLRVFGDEAVCNITACVFQHSTAAGAAVCELECSMFAVGNAFQFVGDGSDEKQILFPVRDGFREVGSFLVPFEQNNRAVCPPGHEYVNCVNVSRSSCADYLLHSVACHACDLGSYVLDISDTTVAPIAACSPCPDFAQCERDSIVPGSGYWVNTYAGRSGQTLAQTLQCPEGYCNRESGEEDAACVSSRGGFLCGECAERDDDGRELCQSMSVECVPCDECNLAWFFFLHVLFAAIFVGSSLLFRSSSGAWKSLMYFFQMLPFVGPPLRRRSPNSESFAGSSVRALSSVTSLEFVRSSHVGTRCAFRGLSVPGVAFLGLVSPLFYFICFFCVFFVVWQGSVRVAFARWIIKTCFALVRRLVAPVFRRAMSGRSMRVSDVDEYDEHGADGVDGADGYGKGHVEYVESSGRKQHDMAERLLGSGAVEDSSGVEMAAVDDDDGDDDYHAEESAVSDATLDSRAEADDMEMDMETEMKTKLNQRAKPKEMEKRRESASASAEKRISMQRRIVISVAFWRWKWKWAYRFSMSFTALVLASYTTVAETTLRLLNCRRYTVDSEDHTELRLFEAGTFRCYQWWQYFLWIIAVLVVFPFPFYVFLYCKIVSLMYVPFGHRYGARQKAVLDVMQDSFRPGRKGWESVTIGRRLILILVASWTVDVYLRCLLICLFCLLFFGVHLRFSPFRSHRAQNFESLVLLLLAVISCLRMREAVLTSVGESTDDRALSTLFWLEVASAIIVVVFAAEYYVVGMLVKLVGIVKVVGRKLWRILLAVSRRVRPYVVQLLRTVPESPSESADGTDGDGGRSGRVVEYVELEEA